MQAVHYNDPAEQAPAMIKVRYQSLTVRSYGLWQSQGSAAAPEVNKA